MTQRHCDISVTFTGARPEGPAYVMFHKNVPDDIISSFKGGYA